MRRAWIEIWSFWTSPPGKSVALLAEGVDRNPASRTSLTTKMTSPSLRRAWIEMTHTGHPGGARYVALLAEGVDRNNRKDNTMNNNHIVALLAEGVDRNLTLS